jgi:hypothetical protein
VTVRFSLDSDSDVLLRRSEMTTTTSVQTKSADSLVRCMQNPISTFVSVSGGLTVFDTCMPLSVGTFPWVVVDQLGGTLSCLGLADQTSG